MVRFGCLFGCGGYRFGVKWFPGVWIRGRSLLDFVGWFDALVAFGLGLLLVVEGFAWGWQFERKFAWLFRLACVSGLGGFTGW